MITGYSKKTTMATLLRGCKRVSLVSLFRRSLPMISQSCGKGSIPTDQEQATGLDKKELDALIAGVHDPFNMEVQTIPGGTKDKPQSVPSMYPERILGCICDDETNNITWTVVKKGPPQRCDCGHWFKLTEESAVKIDM